MTFKPFSDEQLIALEAAHGRIAVVRGAPPPAPRWRPAEPEPPYEVVFRAPTVGEAEAYEGHAHHEKARAAMVRDHAKATIVAVSIDGAHVICDDRKNLPSVKEVRAAWDKLREKYPGAHLASQDDLQALMGSVKDEMGKE